MSNKVPSTPFTITCFLFLTLSAAFGQTSIRFKTILPNAEEASLLDQDFKAYTLATLNTAEVYQLLRTQEYHNTAEIKVNDQIYTFSLRARDIRAPHYKLRMATDNGVVELPRSPNKTFFGFTPGGKDVRITSDVDYFACMIILGDDELYVEQAKGLVPGAASNKYVIYKGSDNLKKFNLGACGVHAGQTQQFDPENDQHNSSTDPNSLRVCKEVEIALADDHLMFNEYGSIVAVENHNMTVLNNVETNYDFEFAVDLQFSLVEIFVATSSGNDPWTNSTDPGALLDDFTNWGPSGFNNTHDNASLWSNRDFNGDVIGLAWLSTVCSGLRYNVLQDFSTNADFLRVLQAHEMGHNFGADHDANGSPFIMAPVLQNTNQWSTASINAIDNKINSVGCLGPCGAPQPPVANFTADPTEGCTPLVVAYDDLSTNNPTSWLWTFEGGTPATSTNQNPVVTYNSPGSFNVTLMATNAQGSNSVTFTNYIIVGEAPFADFDYFIDELTVDFTNNSSNANSYMWAFGDGGTSTNANPIHVYAQDGIYTVTLTATNECGTDVYQQVIEIITLPFADFSSDVTEGCDPIEVNFINLSSPNAENFSWSFPGGSPPTSFAYEPTVVYETPGTYPVTLTASNQAGDDVVTFTNYIEVFPQPNAEFNFTINGLQVNFNSTGSNGSTYSWNFGDGGTSNLPNPSHTYATGGSYQVSLAVTNSCGTDVLQLTVNVTGAPEALFVSNVQSGCAPLVVQYTNQSGGSPTSFNWIFEGGNPATSTIANPTVTYNVPGSFDVQLTVTNNTGSDVLLLTDYITIAPPPTSNFNYNVNGSQASFNNQSANANSSAWTFGDGQTSVETNPVHTYLADGVYTVTLISSGVCGNDTSTAQVTIQTPPQAAYSYQVSGDCVPVSVVFTNQSSPNATSFEWSFPGGNPMNSNLANPTVTYNSAGAYDVTLIAHSAGGSDTLSFASYINIGAPPDAAFLLSTSGTTVTLDNQSAGAGSYLWMFGDGQTSNETSPVHTYSDFGTYTISLVAMNSCGNDTQNVEIVLSTVPNAFFTYSDHSGCAPFEVTFIDQSQNNPTSWTWSFEGGNPSTSSLQNPTVVYSTPGTYSVSLEVSNAQGTDAILLAGLIEVGGTPDATFNYQQIENIVALEYPGIDYDSLLWSFGDGRTDHSLNPTVTYDTSGQYQISLIVYNPCGTDTSYIWVTIDITATHQPFANAAGWQVRPSPFKDNFAVYGEPSTDGAVTVSLMDMHGRLITRQDWTYSSGPVLKQFDEGHLPQGLILIMIQDKKSTTVLKAVHQ